MRPDDRVRLQHMVEAAESIATFVAGRTRSDLDTDRMLLFAVVRAIEIIGEAASQISDETRSRAEDVPWRAMVGMRNRIVHAYFDIDADIVWKTAVEEGARLAAAAPRAARAGEKRRDVVTEGEPRSRIGRRDWHGRAAPPARTRRGCLKTWRLKAWP